MSEASWRMTPAVAVFLLLAGCSTTPIPSDVIEQVEPSLTFADAKRAPEQHRGKVFLLGGTVQERNDLLGMTWLRLRDYPLDARNRPRVSSLSEGSFLVTSHPSIDPAQYLPGKWVTIVGRLTGTIQSGARGDSVPTFEALYVYAWDPPYPRDNNRLFDPNLLQAAPAGGLNSIGFGPVTYR
jgi:outer membrane lipoprotein